MFFCDESRRKTEKASITRVQFLKFPYCVGNCRHWLPERITHITASMKLIVSGTPIKALDETTYTLIATDDNGYEVHLLFPLEVPDLMPTFGDTTTIAAQSYLVAIP